MLMICPLPMSLYLSCVLLMSEHAWCCSTWSLDWWWMISLKPPTMVSRTPPKKGILMHTVYKTHCVYGFPPGVCTF